MHYGSHLVTSAPARAATGSGNRCQTARAAENRGLLGRRSGGYWPEGEKNA